MSTATNSGTLRTPVCCNGNCAQGETCPVRLAWVQLRQPSWPLTLAATLQDPARASLIHARAAHLVRRPVPAASATAAPRPAPAPTPAPAVLQQHSLLAHWAPRRATPADFVDHKRAASGDRDD